MTRAIMRITQIACLMVLGLMANSPTVSAAGLDGASGHLDPCSCETDGWCTTAGSCSAMGCGLVYACNEDPELVACNCAPCS